MVHGLEDRPIARVNNFSCLYVAVGVQVVPLVYCTTYIDT